MLRRFAEMRVTGSVLLSGHWKHMCHIKGSAVDVEVFSLYRRDILRNIILTRTRDESKCLQYVHASHQLHEHLANFITSSHTKIRMLSSITLQSQCPILRKP